MYRRTLLGSLAAGAITVGGCLDGLSADDSGPDDGGGSDVEHNESNSGEEGPAPSEVADVVSLSLSVNDGERARELLDNGNDELAREWPHREHAHSYVEFDESVFELDVSVNYDAPVPDVCIAPVVASERDELPDDASITAFEELSRDDQKQLARMYADSESAGGFPVDGYVEFDERYITQKRDICGGPSLPIEEMTATQTDDSDAGTEGVTLTAIPFDEATTTAVETAREDGQYSGAGEPPAAIRWLAAHEFALDGLVHYTITLDENDEEFELRLTPTVRASDGSAISPDRIPTSEDG